ISIQLNQRICEKLRFCAYFFTAPLNPLSTAASILTQRMKNFQKFCNFLYAERPRGERSLSMHGKFALVMFALLLSCTASVAQQTSQVQLKIEANNRTLTVSADGRVTADPEIAILHIGFETKPLDAKAAYAAGAKTSNEIVAALK